VCVCVRACVLLHSKLGMHILYGICLACIDLGSKVKVIQL